MALPSLNDLSSWTTTARALANLVLVQPTRNTGAYQAYAPGSLGFPFNNNQFQDIFIFDYEGEQTVTCDSDITDHYTELNVAIADQIALKPVMITTQGFRGELTDVVPTELGTLYDYVEKLQSVSAYVPQLTVTAQLLYNTAKQVYQTAMTASRAAVSAWGSLRSQTISPTPPLITANAQVAASYQPGSPIQTAQQDAFSKFYGWWASRTLFQVTTPWAVFTNMAIKTLRPVQSAETRTVTTFELTFKQIRTTEALPLTPTFPARPGLSLTVPLAPAIPRSRVSQLRLVAQSSTVVNKGYAPTAPAPSLGSLLGQYYNSYQEPAN